MASWFSRFALVSFLLSLFAFLSGALLVSFLSFFFSLNNFGWQFFLVEFLWVLCFAMIRHSVFPFPWYFIALLCLLVLLFYFSPFHFAFLYCSFHFSFYCFFSFCWFFSIPALFKLVLFAVLCDSLFHPLPFSLFFPSCSLSLSPCSSPSPYLAFTYLLLALLILHFYLSFADFFLLFLCIPFVVLLCFFFIWFSIFFCFCGGLFVCLCLLSFLWNFFWMYFLCFPCLLLLFPSQWLRWLLASWVPLPLSLPWPWGFSSAGWQIHARQLPFPPPRHDSKNFLLYFFNYYSFLFFSVFVFCRFCSLSFCYNYCVVCFACFDFVWLGFCFNLIILFLCFIFAF